MLLRPATPADIPQMMDLERACPAAPHWAEEQYRGMFQGSGSDRFVIVLEAHTAGSNLLGFLVARHLAPEWELESVVVSQAVRRQGLGRRLIEALLARAREAQSEAVFLEVRQSNGAARGLYEKAGFAQTGRRARYYADPTEDAIVYRWSMA